MPNQTKVELDSISKQFLTLRINQNLNQNELGKLTGLRQETISNIERGKNYTMENFLLLFNFYVSKTNSKELVLRTLFSAKFKNDFLLCELKKLNKLNNKELDLIIKLLE